MAQISKQISWKQWINIEKSLKEDLEVSGNSKTETTYKDTLHLREKDKVCILIQITRLEKT